MFKSSKSVKQLLKIGYISGPDGKAILVRKYKHHSRSMKPDKPTVMDGRNLVFSNNPLASKSRLEQIQ